MIATSPPPVMPAIRPVEPNSIPALLRGEKRWVAWRAGPLKPGGKFDKYPVDPASGRKIDALDPVNWLSFDDALAGRQRGLASGVGIALSDQHPISIDGTDYILAAIDLDNCIGDLAEHRVLWEKLGKPYVEFSPSGKGLRMVGLSRSVVHSGNAGAGRELYCTKRYVTITGTQGRGEVRDFTSGLMQLEQLWFGNRGAQNAPQLPKPIKPLLPESKVNVASVLSMLDSVSSDTTYEVWRDVVWAIASTGWASGPSIAHIWSAKASLRYDAEAVERLLQSFDPGRGITLGTLVHNARHNGWSGTLPTAAPPQPPPSAQPSDLPLLMTAAQLRQIPVPPYVVRNVFPAHGLAAIYGEPGSGKSFLALHLAHAIAAGTADWFGFRVRQRPVVYVVLEGLGGMGKRTAALELDSNQRCPDELRFWCRDIHLLTGEGIDLLASEIVAAVGTGAVVIVDTLNQASPGADENTSQDMGKIIANSKRIAAAVEGLTILVHHSGKNRASGLRGHSSLHAAMDVVIEAATVEGKQKTWSMTKAKDDSSEVRRDFDLVPYTVGQDDEGDPVTSCAVQHAIRTARPKHRQPTGKHQKTALAELRSHLQQSDSSIAYEAALTRVAAALDTPQSRRGERAKAAVDALIQSGHLLWNERGVCLA